MTKHSVQDDFSPEGTLARAIDGFKPREPQRDMAAAVERAIVEQHALVVEAGTGTGKTYAYLVPTRRSERKVIVSTGSKALQDQLFSRDLPRIATALGYTGQVALLKGRSNYLCIERLEQQSLAGGDLSGEALSELVRLRGWSSATVDCDISTCTDVAEDSTGWPLVTSTNDNCLGSDCPHYKECFVVKARRKAMESDVVVINHHLYLANMVVKESGFAELIPDSDVVIFDEAHQIPDIASYCFGQQLTSRQLLDLAKDIVIAYRPEVRDAAQLQKSTDRLSQSTQDFRLALGEPGFRGNLRDVLALTPLSVADRFRELMQKKKAAWIFTSATLSINDRVEHFTERLRLDHAQSMLLPSPFDYAQQTLLCVPRFLPKLQQRGAAQRLATQLRPLIEANRWRCFMLCTWHQMMRDLATEFRASLTLPVLLQGETSKAQLLAQFVSAGNALLVATSSFWEGVDMRGDALSCVIIDKLPFTSLDDPLLKASIEDCRRRGGDPFDEVQLPDAVITLKQGVGRLIRDVDDRGVIVICDNRLVMRPYGKTFLQNLPPAARTRNLTQTIRFLSHTEAV